MVAARERLLEASHDNSLCGHVQYVDGFLGLVEATRDAGGANFGVQVRPCVWTFYSKRYISHTTVVEICKLIALPLC